MQGIVARRNSDHLICPPQVKIMYYLCALHWRLGHGPMVSLQASLFHGKAPWCGAFPALHFFSARIHGAQFANLCEDFSGISQSGSIRSQRQADSCCRVARIDILRDVLGKTLGLSV